MDELSKWFPEEDANRIDRVVRSRYPVQQQIENSEMLHRELPSVLGALCIGRSLQLLARCDDVALPGVPSVLSQARIATFQGGADRITDETYEQLQKLHVHWNVASNGAGDANSNGVAWFVAVVFVATLTQIKVAKRLFEAGDMFECLKRQDLPRLVVFLQQEAKSTPFMRSRFQSMAVDVLISAVQTIIGQQDSPPPQTFDAFCVWLAGLQKGVGHFYSLVVARELTYHKFFIAAHGQKQVCMPERRVIDRARAALIVS
jgi:hypothetical protein